MLVAMLLHHLICTQYKNLFFFSLSQQEDGHPARCVFYVLKHALYLTAKQIPVLILWQHLNSFKLEKFNVWWKDFLVTKVRFRVRLELPFDVDIASTAALIILSVVCVFKPFWEQSVPIVEGISKNDLY